MARRGAAAARLQWAWGVEAALRCSKPWGPGPRRVRTAVRSRRGFANSATPSGRVQVISSLGAARGGLVVSVGTFYTLKGGLGPGLDPGDRAGRARALPSAMRRPLGTSLPLASPCTTHSAATTRIRCDPRLLARRLPRRHRRGEVARTATAAEKPFLWRLAVPARLPARSGTRAPAASTGALTARAARAKRHSASPWAPTPTRAWALVRRERWRGQLRLWLWQRLSTVNATKRRRGRRGLRCAAAHCPRRARSTSRLSPGCARSPSPSSSRCAASGSSAAGFPVAA